MSPSATSMSPRTNRLTASGAGSRCRRAYGAISMENHVITGGLGSAVAEVIAESELECLVRIGLRDTFVHGASRP